MCVCMRQYDDKVAFGGMTHVDSLLPPNLEKDHSKTTQRVKPQITEQAGHVPQMSNYFQRSIGRIPSSRINRN